MKKFKKKPKSIKRSHQKTILKRPLWLAPLLIGGFASGVHANNLWDLLKPKVGVSMCIGLRAVSIVHGGNLQGV
ncbi:hypothetical protein MLS212_00630 [Helicobacter pylori]